MDVNLFKSKIVVNGYSVSNFIEEINKYQHFMTKSTFYKKLNGKSEFTQKEIYRIQEVLKLSPDEIKSIFFVVNVS